MKPGPDRTKRAIVANAHQLIADLTQFGEQPHVDLECASGGGWTSTVLVFPTPPGEVLAGLTACERDCVCYLARCGEPVPAEKLRDELESKKIAIYSIATVKRALQRL